MTIRKHKVHDGQVEVVEEEIKNPWLRLMLGTNGWKMVIIILIATQHPLGRGVLSSLGFDWQDTKKINVAAEEAKGAKTELQVLVETIKEVREDMNSIKSNNAILNSKVDGMDHAFRAFQADLSKLKPKEIVP